MVRLQTTKIIDIFFSLPKWMLTLTRNEILLLLDCSGGFTIKFCILKISLMASMKEIAALHLIETKVLEQWVKVEKPTFGHDVFLWHEIVGKFNYKDGQWQPKTESASQLLQEISKNYSN